MFHVPRIAMAYPSQITQIPRADPKSQNYALYRIHYTSSYLFFLPQIKPRLNQLMKWGEQ